MRLRLGPRTDDVRHRLPNGLVDVRGEVAAIGRHGAFAPHVGDHLGQGEDLHVGLADPFDDLAQGGVQQLHPIGHPREGDGPGRVRRQLFGDEHERAGDRAGPLDHSLEVGGDPAGPLGPEPPGDAGVDALGYREEGVQGAEQRPAKHQDQHQPKQPAAPPESPPLAPGEQSPANLRRASRYVGRGGCGFCRRGEGGAA